MPGSAWSSAGVAATRTESPTAVTDLPETLARATGVGELDGAGVAVAFGLLPRGPCAATPLEAAP